jgi:hypothetical protein
LKHVKVGSRTGKLLNAVDGDLKTEVANLSINETEDNRPDLTPEVRAEHNALKFKLDCLQMRAYEAKTVSGVLRAYKELRKVDVAMSRCRLS